ncbi:phosphoadenosine phosphosulfate reductase family protein [Agrobacterium rubi]|nr:phosphoadenosine phosphosulfate reductase family protein [Agrobacterium rubi]NTF23740.1 phosphoadenosine phosphosulfate reductase family protein [Agrobacterium rubi]
MYIDVPEVSALHEPELASYDRILVAFSGGKDSLAALLMTIRKLHDLGVDMSKVELHHHDVDGGGDDFMDWAVTRAYCEAVAKHFGITLLYSYKIGGFEREMNRDGTPTAPIRFEVQLEDGTKEWREVGGEGPNGTRLKFPQVSADLSVRWCSGYLKIDVMARLITNQDRFNNSRTLVITGERAQESTARSKYLTFEPHRTDRRSGRLGRHVDHWRPIHGWSEEQVWDIIRDFGIVPHVAYQLGWSRLSCITCIFGSPDQWATIEHVFPSRFEQIAGPEEAFGVTIRRTGSVREIAKKGTPYAAALANPDLVLLANSREWTQPIHVVPEEWQLPAGAFGENVGPL